MASIEGREVHKCFARVLTKPETQKIIRDLRKQGHSVEKKQQGLYECIIGTQFVFSAVIFGRTYMCRFNKDCWGEQ